MDIVERNIFIFTSEFPPGPGGIGDHAYNLASQLATHGYKVSVLSELRPEFLNGKNATQGFDVKLIPRTQLFHLNFIIAFVKLA